METLRHEMSSGIESGESPREAKDLSFNASAVNDRSDALFYEPAEPHIRQYYVMQIQRFTFSPFQTNTYVCYDSGEAVVIDASCSAENEVRAVEGFVAEHELTVRHLLLTHAHIDHILGCAQLAESFGQGFKLHREEKELLENAEMQGRMFGVAVDDPPEPSGFLDEGDVVSVGETDLVVIHAPGHSPGSICFYDEASKAVISGDVLFQGSIGRTDLWKGSLPELMESIFQKVLPLGDDVRVYPGHGPATTVGDERQSNPFLTHGSPSQS